MNDPKTPRADNDSVAGEEDPGAALDAPPSAASTITSTPPRQRGTAAPAPAPDGRAVGTGGARPSST